MRLLLGLLVVLLLTGCATYREDGYSEFYQGRMAPNLVAAMRGANPAPQTPAMTRAQGDDLQINAAYLRKGYELIGFSNFTSGYAQTPADAQRQGAKVGADLVVIVDPQYAETRTANMPVNTPTKQTYVTNSSATAYGAGSPVAAYGNSTTTSYSSQTNYVPVSADRYHYEAIYYVKRTHWVLGATCRDLTDEERKTLQSNRGAYVKNVVDGQPAFNADILVGDMIVAVDHAPVYGDQALRAVIEQRRGQSVVITLFRDGKTIDKTVLLND